MNLSFRLISTVLAATMMGQSIQVMAQEAPRLAETSAERAQNVTQDKKIAALAKAVDGMNDDYKVIQSFTADLAKAKNNGTQYTIEADVDSYWMTRSLGWFGGGMSTYVAVRSLPELKGFEGAKYVNVALRFAKSFKKPALFFFVVGGVVAVTCTIMYVNNKRQIIIASNQVEQINEQIANAKHNYDTKAAAILDIAKELNSQITQHDRNITIQGLNFPQLRTYTSGAQGGVLQMQTFADNGDNQ